VSLADGILKRILIYYFNCWCGIEYALELKWGEKKELGFEFVSSVLLRENRSCLSPSSFVFIHTIGTKTRRKRSD